MTSLDTRWQRLVKTAREAPAPTLLELNEDRLQAILSSAAACRMAAADLPRWCEVTAWCTLAASLVLALSLADFSPLATTGLVALSEVFPWGPVP